MRKEKEFKPIFLCLQEEIVNDINLSAHDRNILMLVIAFDNDERGCYATNKKIGSYFRLSEGTVSKSIKHLFELGYIIHNSLLIGRSPRRIVRDDLKLYKPGKSILPPTHRELTTLPIEKDILIDIIDSKEIDLKIFKEEKEIFENGENYLGESGLKIYLKCKSLFETKYAILWDIKASKYLAMFFYRIIKLYKPFIKPLRFRKRQEFIIEAFGIIISYRPAYFTNSNPFIFYKQFNDVVQQIKVEERINKLKIRFSSTETSF